MKKETKQNEQESRELKTKLITFRRKKFKLLRYKDMWVFPSIEYYAEGLGSPIALSLHSYDEERKMFEPYTDVTVNLPYCKRETGCQFIDINNNGSAILDWLEENNFGTRTGKIEASGFCSYPEFNFYAGEQFMEYKAFNDKINKY